MSTEEKEPYTHAIREELLYLIEQELTPIACKYRYSDVALESKIKWKPLVLILGNYSSGKSTLINEFLGQRIQETGQAPTDDCFTVLTAACEGGTGELEGQSLVHDDQLPFAHLKQHGEKFVSHFRLKYVDSPLLQDLAIIDTPGMVDSVAEKDRGYNYQQVIGDLAQLADLILILFDPHKAGTIRESYASLRFTLPYKTFEDRMVFVLNRMDECTGLEDLLRVYGTLCWNLSQMLGRKDIPHILFSYAERKKRPDTGEGEYLSLLANQRLALHRAILKTPKKRLEHLAAFLEHHAYNLSHMLEALVAYYRGQRMFLLTYGVLGSLLCAALSMGGWLYLHYVSDARTMPEIIQVGITCGSGLVLLGVWLFSLYKVGIPLYRRKILQSLSLLTPLQDQSRKDSWQYIEAPLRRCVQDDRDLPSYKTLRREYQRMRNLYTKGAKEIRSSLRSLLK